MLFQGATPRELAATRGLYVVAFAFLLQPLLGADDSPQPDSQAVAAQASSDAAEEESVYFGQAKELPTAAGQVWSVAGSPDGHTLAVVSGMPDKPSALA